VLEIAEREAIATSVGCPSSCHELLAVPAHSPQGSGWVAASCLWRVEACQVRVGSYGAGDRLEPGGQLPLRVQSGVLTLSNAVPGTEDS